MGTRCMDETTKNTAKNTVIFIMPIANNAQSLLSLTHLPSPSHSQAFPALATGPPAPQYLLATRLEPTPQGLGVKVAKAPSGGSGGEERAVS